MVAYSFKKQFIEPIERGTKAQTMRNDRARHAREGEELQLYYGMRTRQCRLIGRAICTAVTPVRLNFFPGRVIVYGRPEINTTNGLRAFARKDGFASWADLKAFWAAEHDLPESWQGVLIEWRDFKPA